MVAPSASDEARQADVRAPREALLDVALWAGPLRQDLRAAARGPAAGGGLSFVARADAAWSAPCGCGTSRPGRAGRRCCSGRSRSTPTVAKRGIGGALMRPRSRKRQARSSRRLAGRRRTLLRPLRLLDREDRRVTAARPLSRRTGCWRASSCRARSRARAAWSGRPVGASESPISPPASRASPATRRRSPPRAA